LIEEEMIAWAEESLSVPSPDANQCQVQIEVFEYDWPRQRILDRRGYEKTSGWGVFRRLHLTGRPLPEVKMADGYTLRTIRAGDWEDCRRLADLLNAAFNRSFHNPGEFYNFARLAPCIRPELHFVAEAPDSSFVAHVAVIYDEENRRGIFEPVCTHPAHRRKNLAQNLMLEGLHQMRALGACVATVETGDMGPANSLYDSVGFTEVYQNYTWRKFINPVK
jgi:ribosomal protein S18 acetylase RimI-like enzyme